MNYVVLLCCYNRQCCWNNMIESVSGGEEMSRSSRDLRTLVSETQLRDMRSVSFLQSLQILDQLNMDRKH